MSKSSVVIAGQHLPVRKHAVIALQSIYGVGSTTSEKLCTAEAFAAITSRPAKLLNLNKGILKPGYDADFLLFPCNDYREILYSQGRLKPLSVYSKGSLVYEK